MNDKSLIQRKKIECQFYPFKQNVVGRDWKVEPTSGIGITVFIEAHDAEEANRIAESIGLDFYDNLDGHARWNKMFSDDQGIYAVDRTLAWGGNFPRDHDNLAFVHFYDRTYVGFHTIGPLAYYELQESVRTYLSLGQTYKLNEYEDAEFIEDDEYESNNQDFYIL